MSLNAQTQKSFLESFGNAFKKTKNAVLGSNTQNTPVGNTPVENKPGQTAGGAVNYKGGSYKLRVGSRGGKYILVKGQKVYINKKK
jgi:hypothetical protein